MLKTSHISASGTRRLLDEPKTGGTGSGSEISKPTSPFSRVRFFSPPPVMCASPWTGRPNAAAPAPPGRRSRSARAARRRPMATESVRAVLERQAGQRAPGQRVAVRVQAGGRQADQRVTGRAGGAADDRVERDGAEAGGGESTPCGDGWPRMISGSTASSPPGISTPASSAPAFRPSRDRRIASGSTSRPRGSRAPRSARRRRTRRR